MMTTSIAALVLCLFPLAATARGNAQVAPRTMARIGAGNFEALYA